MTSGIDGPDAGSDPVDNCVRYLLGEGAHRVQSDGRLSKEDARDMCEHLAQLGKLNADGTIKDMN